mmetsp:Transcript_20473/g.52581  ORF Transcript_20473/g.52581 Transcript_20473/m.52581 type:complete len:222 (+) Transcript_20473:399-1064(+)
MQLLRSQSPKRGQARVHLERLRRRRRKKIAKVKEKTGKGKEEKRKPHEKRRVATTRAKVQKVRERTTTSRWRMSTKLKAKRKRKRKKKQTRKGKKKEKRRRKKVEEKTVTTVTRRARSRTLHATLSIVRYDARKTLSARIFRESAMLSLLIFYLCSVDYSDSYVSHLCCYQSRSALASEVRYILQIHKRNILHPTFGTLLLVGGMHNAINKRRGSPSSLSL